VAAEVTRDLPTRETEIETPLETTKARVPGGRVVAVPVLRGGRGMLDAFLQPVPRSRSAASASSATR
jgi:uracil phosphoribosyltransferase